MLTDNKKQSSCVYSRTHPHLRATYEQKRHIKYINNNNKKRNAVDGLSSMMMKHIAWQCFVFGVFYIVSRTFGNIRFEIKSFCMNRVFVMESIKDRETAGENKKEREKERLKKAWIKDCTSCLKRRMDIFHCE